MQLFDQKKFRLFLIFFTQTCLFIFEPKPQIKVWSVFPTQVLPLISNLKSKLFNLINKCFSSLVWRQYFFGAHLKCAIMILCLSVVQQNMRVTRRMVLTHLSKALYEFGCFKEKVWSFLKFWIWQRCYFTELPWTDFACLQYFQNETLQLEDNTVRA